MKSLNTPMYKVLVALIIAFIYLMLSVVPDRQTTTEARQRRYVNKITNDTLKEQGFYKVETFNIFNSKIDSLIIYNFNK